MPYAENGPVRLYYETFGSAESPALALVNGLGSQCISLREELCEMFVDAGFFVLRSDNRDVGLSTKLDEHPPDLAEVRGAIRSGLDPQVPYTLSDMAADTIAVLDHAGVDRAHVMGFSMGGMIVQTLAIEHGARLLTMTSVMSTTGDPDVGHSSPEALRLLLEAAPPDRAGVVSRAIEAARTYGSQAYIDEERIAGQAGEAFDRCFHPAGTTRQLMAIQASGSRSEALRSVRVPALVIHGDEDRLIDASGGRRTAEVIPGARFVLVEGMGHDYPPEHWETLVSLKVEHAALA